MRYISTPSKSKHKSEMDVDCPLLVPMRQHFDDDEVRDLEGEIARGVRAQLGLGEVRPGQTVAIGVGSRGVSPIRKVVATLVREIVAAGLEPFIVPAMGSHGGGTAAGQQAVLEEYGIAESTVGAPVRATMETQLLGTTSHGVEVHIDLNAFNADHIVIVARVKPHTGFRSDIESGLCKMLAVGMGKSTGASKIHEGGLTETIPEAATVAIDSGRLLFGVALVENAFDRPYIVKIAGPDEFHHTDRDLLVEAKELLPRIPIDRLDLLIVDEMGKDISGTGMDTNVIGMWRRIGGERVPDYGLLSVLRLRKTSEGNASGIGMADFTTQTLVDAIDRNQTYLNAITAMVPFMARIPLTLPTDRECLETAIGLATRTSPGEPRIGRIRNTLELEEFLVTQPVAAEIEGAGGGARVGDAGEIEFERDGRLSDLPA